MQRENFKPKEDKAKHGLMIRAKNLIFGFGVLGFTVEEKRDHWLWCNPLFWFK